MNTKILRTCDQFNDKNTNQETQTPEMISTVLCPNCDGDGGYVDDNNPHGWQPCSYCGGKTTVSYSEAEEWHTWDDNFGFNEM